MGPHTRKMVKVNPVAAWDDDDVVWPDLYRCAEKPKFWELGDDIVQNVMDTNYVAADQMARRAAPLMVKEGWGRIINVTTKLDTMNRPTSGPYGASKAALEMATEIWAPGARRHRRHRQHPQPRRRRAHAGHGGRGECREPRRQAAALRRARRDGAAVALAGLIRDHRINGYRFDALSWDKTLPPAEAARRIARRAGFELHPLDPGGI